MSEKKVCDEYHNACQGKKTTYSNGYKEGDLSEKYFTIEQDGNKIFLTKHQVAFIIKEGQVMVQRWKIGRKFHKATGMRYKDNNG